MVGSQSSASLLLATLLTPLVVVRAQLNDAPQIKDVSAMCTINGITASILFDRPFSGLIYSLGYERIHECLYYNSVLTESVLFSIPVVGCGTHKSYSNYEMIETLENRVYVQMDKYAQTIADKQFAFVCQQPYVPLQSQENEIRRHPSSLGKPITPFVSNRYQVNSNWRSPIQPNHILHGTDQNGSGSFSQSKSPVFYTMPTALTTIANTIANPTDEVLAQKATTYAFGGRNSWSILGPNQQHGFDDFVPGQTARLAIENDDDDDLLKAQTYPKVTSTSTTTKYQTTVLPIVTSKPTDNIDISHLNSETRLFANQQFEKISDSVVLEIQRGQGPFNKSIDGAVKIGDLISLTVHGKATSNDESQFNIFVHSCYASDENNTIKINLIDSNGCAIHSQVLQSMQRLRRDDVIYYFFPLKAFKFPGPTEVFFYCSVDISPEYNFSQLCNKTPSRRLRSINNAPDQWVELNLSKNVTIQLPTANDFQRVKDKCCLFNVTGHILGLPNEDDGVDPWTIAGATLGFLTLTIVSVVLAMFFALKFRK